MNQSILRASLLLLLMATSTIRGAIYFVDDTSGNDLNSGLSSRTAWQTLAKVSSVTFQPGDKILLKSGGSWLGQMELKGSGTDANPIIVDSYGQGNRPFINGDGYKAAVLLHSVSGWEVNSLEIINDTNTVRSGVETYRAGVLATTSSGYYSHIYLRNLVIHDIYPQSGPFGYGIHVEAASKQGGAGFSNVRIQDNQISYTGYHGIFVRTTGDKSMFNTNIIISGNSCFHVGSAGMETGHCDGVLVENNVATFSGAVVDSRQGIDGGDGFWCWYSRNVIVQSNRFLSSRAPHDGCGVHVDFNCTNVVVQYNLSMDNEGGFVEILGNCSNAVYRYNLSINDGWRVKGVKGERQEGINITRQDGYLIWVSDYAGKGVPGIGSSDSKIYNNTIYVRPGMSNFFLITPHSLNTSIQNNLFYICGHTVFADHGTNTVLQNNLWTGNLPMGLPTDSGGIFADPQFAQAGGTNAADYLLSGTSPAIGAGVIIPNNGGHDYWGNPLSLGAPCIGANQRDFSGSGRQRQAQRESSAQLSLTKHETFEAHK